MSLKRLISKLKSDDILPIIQTPIKDLNDNINPHLYTKKIEEIANLDNQILVVNHYILCDNKYYKNGELDQKGHIEVAKQLMKATTNCSTEYQLNEAVIKNLNNDLNSILNKDNNSIQIDKLLKDNKALPLVWLFIGDSITHGAKHTYGYDSVPQLFEKYIREEVNRIDDVIINTAVSGGTTQSFLNNINVQYERYSSYTDVVFIMFGTNDCIEIDDIEIFKQNLDTIIKRIKADGAIPIIRTPTPCIEASNRAEKIDIYADVIRKCAIHNNIILVDHYKSWIKTAEKYPNIIKAGNWISGLDLSKIHPSTSGQLNMFHNVLKSLGLWNEDGLLENLNYQMPVFEQSK